ncbi:MAG: sulfate transporter CysZ [Pseudomonadota bacterium]
MIADALKGVSHVLNGFRLIRKRGVKRFVAIPTLINLILFSFAIWYGYSEIDQLLDQILPDWLDWLEFIIKPIFFIASLIIVFFTFTLIANLIGAPFNSVLSEKIEQNLNSKTIADKANDKKSYLDLIKSAGMGLGNEISKLIYMASRTLLVVIIMFIPGLNVFTPFLWFLFGAWMLAIEYLDYPMGNQDMPFKQQLKIIKENRFYCLGMGAALLFMTITPILNFFAMPVGVAAATSLWTKQINKSISDSNR